MCFVVCCTALLFFGVGKFGWKALSIPTGSMRPTMPPGTLVFVHRVSTSSLEVGDVITYINPLHPSTTISHRIIKKIMVGGKIPGFITKGDANKVADSPIVAGLVEGKIVWHLPHAGYWLLDAKKPIIILPIIYIAALIIMAEEVIRLKDYLRSTQPYHALSTDTESFMPNRSRNRFALVASLQYLY